MKKKKRKDAICFFGTYESSFPRTITLKEACRQLNIKVLECHAPFWELKREKVEYFSQKSIIKTIFQLILIYSRLAFRYMRLEDHDAVIVGYNGYFDMPLAKLLAKTRRKVLIYTPVFPLYETSVEDRGYINKDSKKSKAIHLIDEISCRLADLIIIETETYLNYYSKEFKIPKDKYFQIPLGADEINYFPRGENSPRNDSNTFRVLFYGKFIPLQGIPYITKAAKLLEGDGDIKFEIIGSGQLSKNIKNLAQELNIKNVSFIEWINYRKIPDYIQRADICLGIFGNTPKARRGIPIKVYEALSMKKPVITGDSPAAREVFDHKVNSILCEMANPKALAESILLLKNDKKLREDLAETGFRLYQDRFSAKQLARKFEEALNRCL